MRSKGRILALSGGVGGAKLAAGLQDALPAGDLMVVANTGDDFEYLGLHVSPDADSLMYALADVNNPDTGWGRAAESWAFMEELERLRIESWFRLGDRDLAVHVYRTACLRAGRSLSEATADLCGKFDIAARIVPMSDDPVRTVLQTDVGRLAFQDYFVRRQCGPAVAAIAFEGAERAAPAPDFLAALREPRLAGIVICPSNPWLSIDPILAVPGVADAIAANPAPVVAVSPIVQGRSLKGPTGKIMADLGIAVSAASVAARYRALVDAFVIDSADGELAEEIVGQGMRVAASDTIMRTAADRRGLAGRVLALLEDLQKADLR